MVLWEVVVGRAEDRGFQTKGPLGKRLWKWECSDVLRNREEAEAGMELPQNDQV
jgi:hypothetical protein